ncbi:MAG: winged helix-turn-helix domain-containing protein, partial [Caulobacteraceae bacterium]
MNQGRSFADLSPIRRMNAGTHARAAPIDLSEAPDFHLGATRVRPSTCEVSGPRGSLRLQHKVMQVLVALAEAGGAAVSREVLRTRCWGSQVVSDDSINRCMLRLRRLSEVEAPGAFTLETIPKLGYRLTAKGAESPVRPPARRGGLESWAPWAGATALIAGAVAAAFLGWPSPPRWTVARSERLVSTPWPERHPAISPDGAMLAYSAGPDIRGRHIYLKPLVGGNAIQLTDDGFDDAAPDWSADGARILYVAYRAGGPCRIMVAAVPAGPARQLARCQGAARSRAVWSARGEALFIADAAGPADHARIVRLDLATGRRAAVSHPPGGLDDQEPAVSPNGRWLAFLRQSETLTVAILHDLRTGRERSLADLGDTGGLAWASDSRTLFLSSGNGVESTIWAWRA